MELCSCPQSLAYGNCFYSFALTKMKTYYVQGTSHQALFLLRQMFISSSMIQFCQSLGMFLIDRHISPLEVEIQHNFIGLQMRQCE